MIKFLFIIGFTLYLVYKIGGLLFKILFMGLTQSKRSKYSRGWRKHSVPDSNVNIQHIPKKSKDFKGGDYIDYEEIK